MTVFIDADGCPVVDIVVNETKKLNIKCIIICDTSHRIERNGIETITVPKGNDSVDFKLVNMLRPGDIVVTQDYGLAAMCLARKARPINENGLVYTGDNIDALLFQRHISKEIRMSGGRVKGNFKRMNPQNKSFKWIFRELLTQQE